ncbi:YhcN/YlaJ family sporulation lipoprotein [Lederbergia sp. NSJ-179]|uniref:YhcN/YlaJ family sporulation lipoprotein n=1 Tax=Lederbergia sp. NSJ-179 TaxID=2931402 RepID=UPI001FD23D35|nr:YhcN/YlaJ family sporulation lipoprotein [Lederbergia sp. NSJ-179]MCJ7842365.1 YhcN/YlaJ family sporulation lipoprotein [Lederbergia sp. NSJ-179]
MKIVKSFAVAGLASLMLVGCGTNDNNQDRVADNNDPLDVNYDTRNTRDGNNTRNDLTYRNNGTHWDGNNVNNRDGYGADNVRNDSGNNRTNAGNNTGNNNAGGNGQVNNDNRIDVADDIADDVTDLKEVDRAYVLTTGNNAYVAVRLSDNQNNKLSNDVKDKIADRARKTDKNLDNVFVSENPDFFGQMRDYRDEINNGNPVSGFFEQFTDTVERIFPTSR